MRKSKLTVMYLIRGNLEVDVRKGARFRWRATKGGVFHVFEYDKRHRLVWSKSYSSPVSASVERRDG